MTIHHSNDHLVSCSNLLFSPCSPAARPAAPAARPAPSNAPAAAPQNAVSSPSMNTGGSGGGLMGGIVGGIVQGMAFGTGSAIAHRAVDSIAGPRQVEHVHTNEDGSTSAPSVAASSSVCAYEKSEFERCVQNNGGSLDSCRNIFDALSQCQKSHM